MSTPAAPTVTPQLDLSWPDFPAPLRDAAGGRIGDALYAGLGSCGQRWYRLDLGQCQQGWRAVAAFPGTAPSGAAHAAAGDEIFIFGGALQAEGAPARQSDAIWRYNAQRNDWTRLPAALPFGALGAAALPLDRHTIALFGGYNRDQFDRFCAALAGAGEDQRPQLLKAYMARPAEDFGWNRQIWLFDVRAGALRRAGELPFPPLCGAAALVADGAPLLASGEIKPGLRGQLAWRGRRDGDRFDWQAEALPAPAGGAAQEGVAAAFGGLCGALPLVAGGTCFPGATANYRAQQWHAHAGLSKTWRRDIYLHHDGRWRHAGLLPAGRAHGLAFQLGPTLLLVGGDTDGGAPMQQTWALTLHAAASHATLAPHDTNWR